MLPANDKKKPKSPKRKSVTFDVQENGDILFQNVMTLLYPEMSQTIHRKFLAMFIAGLITPNDEENRFSSEGYDSPKQLYLMWTL